MRSLPQLPNGDPDFSDPDVFPRLGGGALMDVAHLESTSRMARSFAPARHDFYHLPSTSDWIASGTGLSPCISGQIRS